ncbi:hypothetical protein [Streptomyces sp. NPDC059819]|uniref:hypothetical protein n=1 Tax=Streptomyces sp. NPDC059819 TaxID=3346963 RepID=UPI00365E58A4
MTWRVPAAAASTGAALALWAAERTAAMAHAPWIDELCALVLVVGCVFLGICQRVHIRWLLCAVCLLGMLFLQNKELDQQVLHQHGRTEHVRVRQIQWSAGDGMGDSDHLYTVTVLDGPPLNPIEESGFMGWKWAVGGTYTVTVDPQGRAPLGRGNKPGPPVVQRLLQIPLGLGLAFVLWRPADLLLRRLCAGTARRTRSTGPQQARSA